MSSSDHRLTVRAADPLAEISVYDGRFRRAVKGVGRYPDTRWASKRFSARPGGVVRCVNRPCARPID